MVKSLGWNASLLRIIYDTVIPTEEKGERKDGN